jgi:hypothetical protein
MTTNRIVLKDFFNIGNDRTVGEEEGSERNKEKADMTFSFDLIHLLER